MPTDVSLTGKRGRDLQDLIDDAIAHGQDLLADLVTSAVKREGPRLSVMSRLFSGAEQDKLVELFASLSATADLLGRAQVRQRLPKAERESQAVNLISVPIEYQDTNYSCGSACVASIARHFGVEPDTEGEAIAALGSSPRDGTSPDAIAGVFEARGLTVQVGQGLAIEDLVHSLALGAPVICAIQAYGSAEDYTQDESGHYVVVCGVDVEHVYAMDPSADSPANENGWARTSAGYVAIPQADFLERWHDREADGTPVERLGIAVGAAEPVREEATIPGAPTPAAALKSFKALVPTLGVTDALVFDEHHRRRAFTLAVATEMDVLHKVQGFLADKIETGVGFSAGPAELEDLLNAVGVGPVKNGYSEMVFRTNIMSSYIAGSEEERKTPEMQEAFPVWRYSNPDDGRSRPLHAAKNGNYYPASMSFEEVRGEDIEDVAQCRCVPIPIYKTEWAALQAEGATLAMAA